MTCSSDPTTINLFKNAKLCSSMNIVFFFFYIVVEVMTAVRISSFPKFSFFTRTHTLLEEQSLTQFHVGISHQRLHEGGPHEGGCHRIA